MTKIEKILRGQIEDNRQSIAKLQTDAETCANGIEWHRLELQECEVALDAILDAANAAANAAAKAETTDENTLIFAEDRPSDWTD